MAEITFFGDVFLPKAFSFKSNYKNIVLNLEAPITNHTVGMLGKVNLKSEKNHLRSTFGEELAAVCLANNHIVDYCKQGFEDTISNLNDNGINYFGAGISALNISNPCLINIDGCTVALLGYVCPTTSPSIADDEQPGVELIEIRKIAEAIKRLKNKGVTRIIVSFHWGAEEVKLPKEEDIRIAREVLDMGADLIIGHHAHCIQSWECYKDKYIFYGLGNCMFPDLDVPSFYGEKSGLPSTVYRKKQNWWNRESLAVVFDVQSGVVKVDKLSFNENELKVKGNLKLSRNKTIELNKIYKKYYKLVFVYSKFRVMFYSYIQNPKLPKWSHVTTVYRFIITKDYK